MTTTNISDRLQVLSDRGVELVDPRQVYIEDNVMLEHIFPGAVLFPGTRLSGKSTVIAPGAKIGSEGPAIIVDSVIGADAEVASGFVTGSVLLDKARIGANGHIRSGTLLEEGASVAHAVGLKQTIYMLRDLGIPYKLLQLFNLWRALSDEPHRNRQRFHTF